MGSLTGTLDLPEEKIDNQRKERLKKLEAAVKELQAHSHDTPAASGNTDARLDEVERLMRDSGLV